MTQEIQIKLTDMIKRGATKKALIEFAGETMTIPEAKEMVGGLLKKYKPILKDTSTALHKAVVYQVKKGRSLRDLLKNGIEGKYGKIDLKDYGATDYGLRKEFSKYQRVDVESKVVDAVIAGATGDGLYTEDNLFSEVRKHENVDVSKVRKNLHNLGYGQLLSKEECITPRYLMDKVVVESLYRAYGGDEKALQRVVGRTLSLLKSGNMDLLNKWVKEDAQMFHTSRKHYNMTEMDNDEVLGTLNASRFVMKSTIDEVKLDVEIDELAEGK